MPITSLKETNAFYYDSYGGTPRQLTIDIDVLLNDAKLDDEDKKIVYKLGMQLVRELTVATIKKDPERIRSKEVWLAEARNCFELANLAPIYIKEIPNEYDPDYGTMAPWLMVTCRFGVLKVGWRKRVITLDWSASDIKKMAYDIFPDEDVTKDGRTIHCWGYEKLVEYLKVLAAQTP